MRHSLWTAVYESDKERDINSLKFTNLGQIVDECHIIFKKNKCYLLINVQQMLGIKPKIIRECVDIQAEEITDVLSWRFRIPLRKIRLVIGNPFELKADTTARRSDAKYKGLLLAPYTPRNKELLEAYREILNEKSSALRFLMCYRMIEMISKEVGLRPDDLIVRHFPEIKLVSEKRNPKRKATIYTHKRNKIHATNNRYSFPYRDLEEAALEMEGALKEII